MKRIYKYLITFGVGFAMALLVAINQKLFNQTEFIGIIHVLINSFTIPAVLITGMGGLMFISNEGGFDIISYGMMCFLDMFRKERKNKFRSFYDYKESREEKNVGFGFMVITGLFFMALVGILCIVWLNCAK